MSLLANILWLSSASVDKRERVGGRGMGSVRRDCDCFSLSPCFVRGAFAGGGPPKSSQSDTEVKSF